MQQDVAEMKTGWVGVPKKVIDHELARDEIEIAIRLRPNQIEFQQLKQAIEN